MLDDITALSVLLYCWLQILDDLRMHCRSRLDFCLRLVAITFSNKKPGLRFRSVSALNILNGGGDSLIATRTDLASQHL